MSLIEVDFANETWPVIRDFVSAKLYERFCNGMSITLTYKLIYILYVYLYN